MSKRAKQTDLQKLEAELTGHGVAYSVLEYPHGYFDVTYKDENGDRVKREYRPDGSELLRDDYGKEVK